MTEDKPPLFNSWKGWYALVLGALAVTIILLMIFSKAFI